MTDKLEDKIVESFFMKGFISLNFIATNISMGIKLIFTKKKIKKRKLYNVQQSSQIKIENYIPELLNYDIL